MVRTKPEQSSVALRESSRTDRSPVAACACPARRAPSIEARRRKSMRARSCSPAEQCGILDSSPAHLPGKRAVQGPPNRAAAVVPRLLAQYLASRVQLVPLGKGRLDLGGIAFHVPAGVGEQPRKGLPDARIA